MALGKDEVEILMPRTGQRDYRRIVFNNSLQVLFISDPDTNKPGGHTNSFYCIGAHTDYHFDVDVDSFEEALDSCKSIAVKKGTPITSSALDTLEIRPKARGVDTRNDLIKFYKENYLADIMHLVV